MTFSPIVRVITDDDLDHPGHDDEPITSAKIVQDIRNVMNDTKIVNVPIQAYIIPSVDAHQVGEHFAVLLFRVESQMVIMAILISE